MRSPACAPLLLAAVTVGLLAGTAAATDASSAAAPPGADAVTRTARSFVLLAAGDIACDPADEGFGSDSRCRQDDVGRLVAARVARGADRFVALGDLQYEDGAYRAFTAVYDAAFGAVRRVTWPVAGNHEWHQKDASGYFRYFGRRAGTPTAPWRTFRAGPGWRVVLLDSSCEEVGGCGRRSPQGRWLGHTLRTTSQPCVVAAWHHPLQSSGPHGADPASADQARPLWRIADAGGVDIVLNGHDHTYERFAKLGGVQEFVVGTGGKSHYGFDGVEPGSRFRDNRHYGVLRLRLGPDRHYGWTFLTVDGQALDRGRGRCTNRPAA